MSERKGPLVLVDGMSLAYRAYFALPPELATTTGIVTNAVHGFFSMVVNIIRDYRPSALAVAFDAPGDTFRDEAMPEYKAGRASTPEDLSPQFDLIRDILRAMAVPVIEVPGFEADDVLATLATQARERGREVLVVTGDRDCFQLVEDPYVRVLYNRRGVSDCTLYDEAGIRARTGVEPWRYPMLAALRGDPSDNLPGVPGVGDKTAAKLLATYGDLDGIFAHLDSLGPKLRENLAASEAQVRANAALTPLVRTVPLKVSVEDLELGGWDLEAIRQRFDALELKTLWARVSALLADGSFGPPAPGSRLPSGQAAGVDDTGGETALGATGLSRLQASGIVSVQRPQNPEEGARMLRELLSGIPQGDPSGGAAEAVGGSSTLIGMAGCFHGEPGRSPLVGVAFAAAPEASGPAVALWLEAGLLQDAGLREVLSGLLASQRIVGHQIKELLRSLFAMGLRGDRPAMDTAVAAYLLDPSADDYPLEAVVESYLGTSAAPERPQVELGESQLSFDDAQALDDPTMTADAAFRALLLEAPLRHALERNGLAALHDEIEAPLVAVLARMEVVGIRVDVAELRRIAAELVADCKALEAEIQRIAGHAFNVNSTPQLRVVLFDELGLTPGRRTKTGYSTDAATLESLRDQHPIVDAILRYREVEKLRSTYGEGLLAEVAADGRIHATFRQTVARTGRLSSERPNLHNIPVRTEAGRRLRRAFVPAEGCSFLVADYDQLELRVIAHLSDDPGLVEAFSTGADVHRSVAAGIYGIPPEEVTRAQRERAKMVSYGLAYGMEAFGLSRRLATGVDEATDIMERYFSAFPRVRAYMEATVAEARERGFTRTLAGRIRPLPELRDRNYRVRQAAERQAMNAGIQGLAADLFKTALVRIDRGLLEGGYQSRLVLQVHDEVIVEVVAGEEERVGALVRSSMTGAAALRVPLEVSMAWGSSWAAAKAG